MPIPVIVLAITAAAGIGRSVKGSVDKANARKLKKNTQERLQEAVDRLEKQRKQCSIALENLGQEKVDVLNGSMTDFLNTFEKIKNIEVAESEGLKELEKLNIDKKQLEELEKMQSFASAFVKGAVSGAAGGALTAFAANSIAGAFADVSARTAEAAAQVVVEAAEAGVDIAAVAGADVATVVTEVAAGAVTEAAVDTSVGVASEVALEATANVAAEAVVETTASNATLTFLQSGVYGVLGASAVGSLAILGGMIAGPALMIMGAVVGAKGGITLEKAKTNAAKVTEYCEQLKNGAMQCVAIRRRTNMFYSLLARMDASFLPQVREMEAIIAAEGTDYRAFAPESRAHIAKTVATATAIKAVLDTPILNEDGSLTRESEEALVR